MFNKSLDIHEAINNQEGIANQCGSLGNLQQIQGNHANAKALYEKALSIYATTGINTPNVNIVRQWLQSI